MTVENSSKDVAAKYETIVVFKPELSESQVKDEEKKLETLLKNEGATSIVSEPWGKKEIAYTVRKCKVGTFVCFKYESLKSDTVKNVTSTLRISDSIIKYQTHRKADKVRKFKGNPRRPVNADQGDDFVDSMDDAY